MSRRLARILNKAENEVEQLISSLEARYGYPNEDIRYLQNLSQRSKQKIAVLGLDPADTTDEELAAALRAKASGDNRRLEKSVGLSSDANFEEKINCAIRLITAMIGEANVWQLKPAAAKHLLSNSRPNKTMKRLGYRSIASLIKREKIDELLIAAPIVESPSWNVSFQRAFKKLETTAFQSAPLSFVCLSIERWGDITGPSDGYVSSPAAGAVAVWPSKANQQADLLTLLALLRAAATDLDANLRLTDAQLATVHPALAFWKNSDDLIHEGEAKAVSFNLKDVYDGTGVQCAAANVLANLKQRYAVSNFQPATEFDDSQEEFDYIPEQLTAGLKE